jgi:DNA helicase-2/ATP-dependent DNA helicase PcrA
MESHELEEERRLCYVGVTRARRRLYVTYANMRTVYGSTSVSVPSRFLMEMPKGLMVNLKGAPARGGAATGTTTGPTGSSARPASRTNLSPTASKTAGVDPEAIGVGVKVRHPKWGIGTVVTKEGTGSDAQVKVAFPGLGIKSLILGYANLEPVE